MNPREVDKREFIPAGRKSAAGSPRAGMSARRIAGLAIPFVASVLATMTVVLVGGAFVAGKPATTESVFGVPMARVKHVADDPKANPSWLAGGAPDWVTQSLAGLFKGVGGSPAVAASGERPVIGRVATFTLLPIAAKPSVGVEPVAEPEPPAPAAETARSTRVGATTPGPNSIGAGKDAKKARDHKTDPKAKVAGKPAAPAGTVNPPPSTPREPVGIRESGVATLGKPASEAASVGGMTQAELSVVEAIRQARADFRLTDVAADRLRKLVSMTPNMATRPSLESQIGELSTTVAAVARERTQFDLFADFFAAPDIGAYGETALRTCLAHVPAVASTWIARKTVLIESTIPAYFVLVDAPAALGERAAVEASIVDCLAPIKSAGTVSLLLNVKDPDTRALAAAMMAVARPFAYNAVAPLADATGMSQNRPAQ